VEVVYEVGGGVGVLAGGVNLLHICVACISNYLKKIKHLTHVKITTSHGHIYIWFHYNKS
jgi:hypothetical protein